MCPQDLRGENLLTILIIKSITFTCCFKALNQELATGYKQYQSSVKMFFFLPFLKYRHEIHLFLQNNTSYIYVMLV